MKLSARKHLGTTGRGSDRSPERGPGLLRGTGSPAEVTAEEFPPSAGITLRGGLRRNGLPRSSGRTRALQHESGAKADGEPEHIIAGLWRAGNERNRGAFGTVPGLVAAVQGEGSFLADTTVVGWLCRGGNLRRALTSILSSALEQRWRGEGLFFPQKHPEVLENAVQAAPGAKGGEGFSDFSADFP